MSQLMKNIEARTKLAGTNKLEILLFTLGVDPLSQRRETYGINVFKVREVLRVPPITRAPDMPSSVEGMVSLRGSLIPVIDLARLVGISHEGSLQIMIVTEYNGHTQGFLVEAVDTILRLDWSAMRVPPDMLINQTGGMVTSVTELQDNRLVMMMDVEKILSETVPNYTDDEYLYRNLKPLGINKKIFFTDDSTTARKQVEKTLQAIGVEYQFAVNGKLAWQELAKIADFAEASARPVSDFIQLILTDIEMPEMDGFMLVKKIKSDQRFNGIPVVMHSSLSTDQNQQLGLSIGADAYIPKFDSQKLAEIITRFLLKAEDALVLGA
jgi:two-component system, chemotaxis family, chemotaxis protein CheV